jgi:hypothetical protein
MPDSISLPRKVLVRGHPETYTRLDSGLRRNDEKGKDNVKRILKGDE